jgi:4-nitrophenyl phosphatase
MIKAILMDLDGVVYRGRRPVHEAPEFIDRWQKRNVHFAFITNRSGRKRLDIVAHLREIGVECRPEQVLTSATVTASHLGQGSVYAIGGDGLLEELHLQGLNFTEQNPDYVVVGGDPLITYDKLVTAVRLIIGGAQFVATNADRLVDTETGVVPGNGAIVHAVAYATGIQPQIIGKPEPLIIMEAIKRLGVSKDKVLLVGDNLETDVEAGRRAGVQTVHLLTGISSGRHVTKRDYGELDEYLRQLQEEDAGR